MNARNLLLVALGALLLLALPSSASAATCSDYSNQAAAQAAADTRDGDGDGIYCEALPCPCARGAGSSSSSGDSSGASERRRAARAAQARRRAAASRRRAETRRRAAVRRKRAERRERLIRRRVERGTWRVREVVDGDTVKIARTDGSARETVRLIGIDTPESRKPGVGVECGAKQATATMLSLAFSSPTDTDQDGLPDAKGGTGVLIRVRTDRSGDVRDRFGRLLAYLDARDDLPPGANGTRYDLGRTQILLGNSPAYRYRERRFARLGSYNKAQSSAKSAGLGAWTACGGDFHSEQ